MGINLDAILKSKTVWSVVGLAFLALSQADISLTINGQEIHSLRELLEIGAAVFAVYGRATATRSFTAVESPEGKTNA